MMKKRVAFLFMILLILSVTGCAKTVTWNGKTEELANLLMVEDCRNLYKSVAMVDYVFAGTVEEVIDEVLPRKMKKHEDAYSTYRIRVDENLKGALSEEVIVSKMGGYASDGTMLLVTAELPGGECVMDSGLPEKGKRYIFLAYAQEDGSLTLSELFDNREVSDVLLEEYRDYVENEESFERQRFTSKYEK